MQKTKARAKKSTEIDALADSTVVDFLTDADLASQIRARLVEMADLMNLAKQRGIHVDFNVGLVDGLFVPTSFIRTVKVEKVDETTTRQTTKTY
jgi:hypothetical protein